MPYTLHGHLRENLGKDKADTGCLHERRAGGEAPQLGNLS